MAILFETLKGIFFFLSITIGIFFLRGYYIFPNEQFAMIAKIMMPGYLVMMGLVIGYVIGNFMIIKNDVEDMILKNKLYMKAFLIGLGIGIILAGIYIFFNGGNQ